MQFRQLAALTVMALLAATASSQVNDVYNPAELPSTTVHARTPTQPNPQRIAATLLDTRGDMINGPGLGIGGTDLSILRNVSDAMSIFGFGSNQAVGIYMAEDFTVPAGGWTINKLTLYQYQTGSTTTSTMTGLYLQIWNGPPNDPASTVIFGDTVTNRLTASTFTGVYRVAENATTGTTRPVMANEASGLNWVLPAGTYWLQWGTTGSLASGPWTVPRSIFGQQVTGNALQLNGTWAPALDGTFAQGLPMTISGPDLPGVTISETAGSTAVTEGGATDSFTVALASAPTADVTITLTPDSQVGVSPTTLTFTPANWNVTQNVTVNAVDDAVAEGNHSGSIAFAVASSDAQYNGFAVPSLSVSIADNDSAGVTVSATTISATEGGATGSFTVVLTSQPTADVSITVTPDAQSTVSSATLTFTAANWNVAQTVTVTAVDDALVEGAHVSTITTGATVSADMFYSGLSVADVTVNITDNDAIAVVVAQSGGTTAVSESGVADTLSVVLNAQPTASVTVTLAGGAQLGLSPNPLVFTAANWNVPQSVTVSAIDDAVVEGPHGATITFAVTSTDANFNGLPVAGVAVSIVDNDAAGASVAQSGGSTAVSESGVADTISVVLNAQPTADVTITLAGGGQLGLSPNPLLFTPANWNVPQSVTVSAIDDAVVEGPHAATITFAVTSTDANFNGLSIAGIPVSIVDNDFEVVRAVPVFGPLALASLLLLVAGLGAAGRRQRGGRSPR